MEKIMAYVICATLIVVGIKGSIQNSLYDGNVKYSINRMIYYFSIFAAFIIISLNLDKIILMIVELSSEYFILSKIQNDIYRIFSLIVVFFIIQIMIYYLLKMIFSSVNILLGKVKRNNFILIILSTIFGFIKGIIAVLIVFVGVITFNSTIGRDFSINLFKDIESYNIVDNIIATHRPTLYYEGDKEIIPTSNVLIYYNGVTLEQGIKSSQEIDTKAKSLVLSKDTDKEKARKLYIWVGSNISYDFDKADNALKNNEVGNSGAIEAWNTRSGICFDYACLYVAMARSVGLKVRLVTGSGYDGKQFGPHAWNEVYITEEERWISVDPTFYVAGDYFDSPDFNLDHIKESIAGEW